jgi:exodeoxyribonuclease VII large subunit
LFEAVAPKLSPRSLQAELRHGRSQLAPLAARLRSSVALGLADRRAALNQEGKLLVSLSYKSVLARGFAVIKDDEGNLVRERADLQPGQTVAIEFTDGQASATITGAPPSPRRKPRPATPEPEAQESLF